MQLIKGTNKYRRLFQSKIYGTNAVSTDEHTCLNCGNTYIGNYCNQCGQSHTVSKITFSKIINNVLNGFTNIDRGFFFTIMGLCYNPGLLIKNYISGKHINYFHPFQMLFILGTLYGLLVSLFGDSVDVEPTIYTPDLNIDTHGYGNLIKEKITDLMFTLRKWLNGNVALRSILMIPIYVIATKWAFHRSIKKEGINIAELFYIRAFVSCQLLFFSLVYLPFNGFCDDSLPLWVELLLTYWIYCCFFPKHWIRNIFATLLMILYWFVILLMVAIVFGLCIGLYFKLTL